MLMNKEFRISNLVFVCILVVGSWFLPSMAFASVFSSNKVVDVSEPIDDDVFLAGERVTISEAIQDDAYVAGGKLEITGDIGEDLMAAGNSVTVSSAIGDDAFLAGESVVMEEGSIVDDLFAAGRLVEVQEGATINGDVRAGGAHVILNGTFKGQVKVGGDVIEVGPTATIAGDLVVYGPTAPTVAEGAVISGSVRHVATMAHERESTRSKIAEWVRSVVTWFIVSLVLLYLVPRLGAAVMERVYATTLSSFGIGFLWLALMIPVTVALFLTVVGWPLALIVVFLSGLLLLLSCSLMPLVVGSWLHTKFSAATIKLPSQWQHALLGAVVVVTLHMIPVLGPLVMFVLSLAILGTLLRLLKKNAGSSSN
jgi:cytoskeletal protein CcmA (bactofilin family)